MTGESPSGDALTSALAAVWEQSRGLMAAWVATIEAAVVSLLGGDLDLRRRREAEREAHKLAGSMGTFGRQRGSDLAREIERFLQGSEPLGADTTLRLSELVVDLGNELRRDAAGSLAPSSVAADAPEVLVVDADADFGHRIVEQAVSLHIRAVAVDSAGAARATAAGHGPALVLVDPLLGGAGDEGLVLVAELAAALPTAPVVVVTDPAGGLDRVKVSRAGGHSLMEKPVSPRVVMASAAQILGRLRSDASILVVDDDPTVAAYLGELLGAGGVHVEGLSDPRRLWAALEELRPDLLVLDLDMPDIDGLELCRMVRNDEAWSALPIVFLTGTDESEWNREMFAAGADDHIPKPMVADDVTTRISNRLERARDQRRRDVDSRSGLAGAPTFTWEVDRLLSLSRRRGFPLAVAVVELDDAGTIEGEHGRAAVDDALAAIGRLLSRTARPEEAAGWAGDRRLAIAMFDQETTPAVERLAKFLEAVRAEDAILKSTPLRVTASVGVSVSPRDGEATGALLAVAGDALERAQDAGGDRVSATAGGGPEGGGSLVDVMVVDDDEALGTLLMHALATRGYRARWLLDGAEAATLLVDHEAMGARVVLLDVGLPGLDGLSVLRKLAEAGVLRSTRVIMLTLRSSDAEVLEALELGAFDHVAKPFSVPVLLHRIARALDSLPA